MLDDMNRLIVRLARAGLLALAVLGFVALAGLAAWLAG